MSAQPKTPKLVVIESPLSGSVRRNVVYVVTNNVTGAQYVGITSKTVAKRWRDHLSHARRGAPFPLHAAIRKYGALSFAVAEVAECRTYEDLLATEIVLIAQLHTHVTESGYNVTRGGEGSLGRTLSQESRERLSAATRMSMTDAGLRERLSKKAREQWRDPESRRRCQEAMRGKVISSQQRQKLSVAGRGRVVSEATREKLRAAFIGKPRPQHVKDALSRFHTGLKASTEARAKMSAARRGIPKSEEWKRRRRKISASALSDAIARILAGTSPVSIAAELGVRPVTLYANLRREGLKKIRAGVWRRVPCGL